MFELATEKREHGMTKMRIANALSLLKAADKQRNESELRILVEHVIKELTP